MADDGDHREDGNCPKCGAALNEYGYFSANFSECNKCGHRWSIISKPIEQFCFDKCPKCDCKNLQCGCGDKRMCNDCSFMWTVGSEEEGTFNTTDGKPASSSSGSCCGGCCNKELQVEKKDPTKTSSCPGGCCGKGGCCGGGGGCCCGGGCCGGCCGGKGQQQPVAKPATEAAAGGGGPLWFVVDIANTLTVAVPLGGGGGAA